MNFNYVDKMMEEYGFSKISLKPFEDFYNELHDEVSWSMRIAKQLALNKYGETITYDQVNETLKIVFQYVDEIR